MLVGNGAQRTHRLVAYLVGVTIAKARIKRVDVWREQRANLLQHVIGGCVQRFGDAYGVWRMRKVRAGAERTACCRANTRCSQPASAPLPLPHTSVLQTSSAPSAPLLPAHIYAPNKQRARLHHHPPPALHTSTPQHKRRMARAPAPPPPPSCTHPQSKQAAHAPAAPRSHPSIHRRTPKN
eukprot:353875-Chlamydomonas_euryale.AAC.2